MSDIGKIDRNLAVVNTLCGKELCFRNVLNSPFSIYGLKYDNEFIRMPNKTAKSISQGVFSLNKHTAGGRVRFKTDSALVAIRAVMPNNYLMSHMPLLGSQGFDMYEYKNEKYTYLGSFIPPTSGGSVFESIITLPDSSLRDITINFPLYAGVAELYVGTEPNATVLKGEDYRNSKPIIYYGSSITQGGCASRPGNGYQAIISRRFNCDYVNLGFSGNAKGEPAAAEFIANTPSGLFFMDYDHNSPSAETLGTTHEAFFLSVREKNPNLPIIIATKTDIPRSLASENETKARKEIIYKTYDNALKRGDKNVAFIDGGSVFKNVNFLSVSPDSCTVDGCHPNDLGFGCMAMVFGDKIGDMLGWL